MHQDKKACIMCVLLVYTLQPEPQTLNLVYCAPYLPDLVFVFWVLACAREEFLKENKKREGGFCSTEVLV